jgi:AraC family transcriptional regulator, transcriptional activator of pobA
LPILEAEIVYMSKKAPSVLNLDTFYKNRDNHPDFYIKTFQEHKKEHPFVMEPHTHDFYLIMLFTKGSGTHTIDLKTYPIKPGSVFFMNPGQMHSWKLSDDVNGHVIFFNSFFYTMDFGEKHINNFPFYSAEKLYAGELTLEQLKSTYPIINILQAESIIKSSLQHSILRSLLDALLYKLFSFLKSGKAKHSNISVISKLQLLIDQFYKDHKPSAFYAGLLNISTQKMNLYTRNYLNKTVNDLLNERLISEAKRLLVYSDKSVSEIAYELNFNDNSYFTKFFKRLEKETPDQFRKRFI